ncbi:Aste57867_11615 [Aphanomyces stellatus]|uniref:procollagen-lysine 5-dioxygenase n=1 Tax=Aphanomyces stellatus TaxID=120398 RepID=A0A485KTR2_9STRA|nr:hypothetical protein As57867_011572 [Aphanomyces stellatus]VFT88473.1 Aste57867_11615 [Aphanomyces stellatus]
MPQKKSAASLLDALSPQLLSLVEASLGQSLVKATDAAPPSISVPSSAKTDASKAEETSSPPLQPPPAVPRRPTGLNHSEVFVLRESSSPGFIVREDFLGDAPAMAVRDACLRLQQMHEMRDAEVGMGKGGDVTSHVAHARGDQLMWLSHDESQVPPPIQHLMKHIERLVHGLVKAAPELGIRNIRSTQFAIFPGNNTRFVKHVDTYSHRPGLRRCITCLYYLNPHWDLSHGGQLRVHLGESSWDVPPRLDTLLLFRSTDVEHEVLPTTVDRLALTTWFYCNADDANIPHTTRTANPASATAAAAPKTFPRASRPPCIRSDDSQPLDVDMAPRRAPPLPTSISPSPDDTIFVSIPSFRDSECAPTLQHLFATAACPARVVVGLCLQHADDDDTAFVDKYGAQVRVTRMHHTDATGPCLARHAAQQLWRGERYHLQIDSHMRYESLVRSFRPHWDAYLVEQLHRCDATKPILTTYPMGYHLPNQIPSDTRPTLLCASHFDTHGLLRQTGKVLKVSPPRPLPCSFWAAGFAFSEATVIQHVPYDPSLSHLFFGEENSMAARLWTHGYDFFAPPEAVVYHLWSRAHRPVFQDTRPTAEKEKAASLARVQRLLAGQDDNPTTGLGQERSIRAFEAMQGVCFATQDIDWTSMWGRTHAPIEFDLAASSAVTFTDEKTSR